jgi:hypothetical protein
MRDTVPSVVFKTRVRDESVEGSNPFRWQDMTTEDIFKGKKVIVFSLQVFGNRPNHLLICQRRFRNVPVGQTARSQQCLFAS